MAKEDIYELEKILNLEKKKDVKSAILSPSFFSCYSQIYTITNENLDIFYPKMLNDKKLLVPTSSGCHILSSINNGAEDITSYDINKFAKFYSKLIISMIKNYDFYMFSNSYNNIINTYENSNKDRYKVIIDEFNNVVNNKFLDDETYIFWETFIRYFEKDYELGKRIFFPNFGYYPSFLAEEELYNNLKDKLDGAKIKYIDSNLSDLNNRVDSDFDLVYISNILDYIDKEKKAGTINNLINIIKDDGYIMAYLFKSLEMDNLDKNIKFNIEDLSKKYHSTCKFYKK